MAAKIIVFGSLNGKLESAFQKLAKLNEKQNFAFAIVACNLLDVDQDAQTISRLLGGEINVPISTYFTVGTNPLPDPIVKRIEQGEDICENLHFLGKRSITKTSDGIRIVALGGVLDTTIVGGLSQEQHLPLHTSDDAKALRGANTADILLTTSWPSAVWSGSNTPLAPEQQASITSSDEIAELCAALKPRYHFSTSLTDLFYEREPFFHQQANPNDDSKAITRFISVAPFGNLTKAKALYAFSLNPAEPITSIPVGTTVSPFLSKLSSRKRGAPDAKDHYGRFADARDHHGGGRNKRSRRPRSPPPGPGQCFFCLSNSRVDTHMICSIGDDAYVTTAKGPLPSPPHFGSSGLPFPGHQLIIPLGHEPTFKSMGQEAEKTYKEMNRFRDSLQAMVASQSKHELGAVTWEINRADNIHLHWQFLPAPLDLIRKGLVEAAFKVEAENNQYSSFREADLGSGVDEQIDFFRLWIWSDDSDTGIQDKELVMQLDNNFRFDLQFGRKVMAKLLGLENRLHWRDVVQDTAEETRDAEKLKKAFRPWDFTL
ncbi:Uu.00g042410.m01.CDS01 [Anthostomella pinea]|uniref:Uu.00g042410.m01.CDS01 n=1 Tax=Anthostomella pinea TaxID=933095 RepID=A0AAI8VAP7_9PEZI|nr:Uu.00g042410.m01.CDS01 [Anthostomella pinea]